MVARMKLEGIDERHHWEWSPRVKLTQHMKLTKSWHSPGPPSVPPSLPPSLSHTKHMITLTHEWP